MAGHGGGLKTISGIRALKGGLEMFQYSLISMRVSHVYKERFGGIKAICSVKLPPS
jgi:hypothetical protein